MVLRFPKVFQGKNVKITNRVGVTLIELIVVISIIGVIAAILLMAVLQTRAGSRNITCGNNLRQIGIAMSAYESAHRAFPPAADKVGFTLHVSLLPFFEREALSVPFRSFRYDSEGWVELFGALPKSHGLSTYRCPDSAILPYLNDNPTHQGDDKGVFTPGVSELDFTSYLACIGAKTAYPDIEHAGICSIIGLRERTRASEVLNGLSNTVSVSEGAGFDPVRLDAAWKEKYSGYAKGLVYQTPSRYADYDQLASDCWNGIGTTATPTSVGFYWVNFGTENFFCTWLPPNSRSCTNQRFYKRSPISPSSYHGSFVNACFADGSVRQIDDDIDWIVWQGMGRISSPNLHLQD